MKINVKSWLTSGLVAGVLILIVGGGLIPILGDEMDRSLARFQLPPLSPGAMVFFACVSLSNGIGVVGLYVLLTPLFRTRSSAVIVASMLFWFFAYFLSSAALVAYGYMSWGLAAKGTAWGILELVVACAVAARLYKAPGPAN